MNCGAPTVKHSALCRLNIEQFILVACLEPAWEGGHKRSKPVFVGVTEEATEDSGGKTERDMMKK